MQLGGKWGTSRFFPYLCIALFVLTDIAIFSSRAVYLDEPFFIALAKTPRNFGLLFQDAQWVFFGTHYSLFGGGSHPPAVSYYLVALYSLLGGFREIPFRLLFSVFGLAAGFGFYGLARRVCSSPLAVTLLFLASPAFFVMTQTLMMDVPMLAFLLVGFHFYFDRDDGNSPRLLVAAICFAISVLAGYTALVPLACLFASAVLTKQSGSRLIAILAAPLSLAVWLGVMLLYYDKNPMAPIVRYYQVMHSAAHNSLAMPAFLGGITVLPWSFFLMRRDLKVSAAIASVAAAILLSFFIDWRSIRYGLSFIGLASSGIGLIVVFAADAVRSLKRTWTPVELFFIIWFPVTAGFFVIVAQFIAARYVLMAMPPLYLLLFKKSSVKMITLALVPTLVLSLMVAIADYRFVGAYPAWVSANINPLQQQGFRILGAAESGLRFYLEKRGIPTLATTDLVATGGDLIVRHSTLFKYSLAEPVETMLTILQRYDLMDRFPLRTFSEEAGAGFHGSTVGVLPYALSRAPYDRIEIAEVNPLVAKLPQESAPGRPIPAWSPEGPVLIQTDPEVSFPVKMRPHTKLEYEMEGLGSLEVSNDGITFRKNSGDFVKWKNLRVVPNY